MCGMNHMFYVPNKYNTALPPELREASISSSKNRRKSHDSETSSFGTPDPSYAPSSKSSSFSSSATSPELLSDAASGRFPAFTRSVTSPEILCPSPDVSCPSPAPSSHSFSLRKLLKGKKSETSLAAKSKRSVDTASPAGRSTAESIRSTKTSVSEASTIIIKAESESLQRAISSTTESSDPTSIIDTTQEWLEKTETIGSTPLTTSESRSTIESDSSSNDDNDNSEVKQYLGRVICGRDPYNLYAALPTETREEKRVKKLLERCTLTTCDIHLKPQRYIEVELAKCGFDGLLAKSLAATIVDARSYERSNSPKSRSTSSLLDTPMTSCEIPSPAMRQQFLSSSPGRVANAADMRIWLLSWFKESNIKGTRGERWMRDEIHNEGPLVRERLAGIAKMGGATGLMYFFLGCGFDEAVAEAFADDVWLAIMSWL